MLFCHFIRVFIVGFLNILFFSSAFLTSWSLLLASKMYIRSYHSYVTRSLARLSSNKILQAWCTVRVFIDIYLHNVYICLYVCLYSVEQFDYTMGEIGKFIMYMGFVFPTTTRLTSIDEYWYEITPRHVLANINIRILYIICILNKFNPRTELEKNYKFMKLSFVQSKVLIKTVPTRSVFVPFQ